GSRPSDQVEEVSSGSECGGACEEQCGSEDEVASEDEESESEGKEVESESEDRSSRSVGAIKRGHGFGLMMGGVRTLLGPVFLGVVWWMLELATVFSLGNNLQLFGEPLTYLLTISLFFHLWVIGLGRPLTSISPFMPLILIAGFLSAPHPCQDNSKLRHLRQPAHAKLLYVFLRGGDVALGSWDFL
ncbi:UNVERIFIED_CONTAM: hypothetical protein Slati_4598500, partial [Sesamum latifolium]